MVDVDGGMVQAAAEPVRVTVREHHNVTGTQRDSLAPVQLGPTLPVCHQMADGQALRIGLQSARQISAVRYVDTPRIVEFPVEEERTLETNHAQNIGYHIHGYLAATGPAGVSINNPRRADKTGPLSASNIHIGSDIEPFFKYRIRKMIQEQRDFVVLTVARKWLCAIHQE